MSEAHPRRIAAIATVVLAVAGAVIAAAALWAFVSSPLDDPTLSASAAVQSSSGDAAFLAFVAVTVCALVIASHAASWTNRTRILVRTLAGAVMVAVGVAAGLLLAPSSEGLQARFMVYPHGEGMAARAHAFTTWIEQLSFYSWAYAACGAAILVAMLVVALRAQRRRASFVLTRPI
jgi:hypothetical protein